MTGAQSPSLTEFLLARLAEDEEWAKAANDGTRWRVDDSFTGSVSSALDLIVEDTRGAPPSSALFHIARHDPARVLADIEAKRAVVELHQGWGAVERGSYADNVLRLLASVYRDHSEFNEAWLLNDE